MALIPRRWRLLIFFPKRYKGHHRCLLLRLLGVGRLAAVTVNTDHGAYGVGVSHWQCC